MANAAVVEFALVITVIGRIERRCIRMLVVSEVGSDLRLLERAVGRSRRESELKRQQDEEK